MNDFEWNSSGWWNWFQSHRRAPSTGSILKFLDQYTFFVGYHGCRTEDVETYYAEGLRLADFEELDRQARAIFLRLPHVKKDVLEEILSSSSQLHDRMLFVGWDERDLVQHCGHYLIYGSEYLCGIAAALTRTLSVDATAILKDVGLPTVFRCRLPRTMIPPDQIRQLAEGIRSCSDRRRFGVPPLSLGSFRLRVPLPSSCVERHFHPNKIPDPLRQNEVYQFPGTPSLGPSVRDPFQVKG